MYDVLQETAEGENYCRQHLVLHFLAPFLARFIAMSERPLADYFVYIVFRSVAQHSGEF